MMLRCRINAPLRVASERRIYAPAKNVVVRPFNCGQIQAEGAKKMVKKVVDSNILSS